MKWLVILMSVLLVGLQVRLWSPNGGFLEVKYLHHRIDEQKTENEELLERNRALRAEVDDLKSGLAAVEERARTELGMVKQDESFFQIVK